VILAVLVGVVAGLGAVSRYVVDQVITHRRRLSLPWGTFVINVSGSFVLGLVTGLALHHGLPSHVETLLGTGFAGGYTTWSTFLVETRTLVGDGLPRHAVVTVVGSLLAGLAAAAAGLSLALV
jgi:CrcB protein